MAADAEGCFDRLCRSYSLYDRCVDVVSAFEFVFTRSHDLAETVDHFERFPRIPMSESHPELTPDFTVYFGDGVGIVGEIANIPLVDAGLDALSEQIGKYDTIRTLQDSNRQQRAVESVDVMLLVPFTEGTAAYKRIIDQRLLNADHSYGPSVSPCIIQFALTDDRYVFQRLPFPKNGDLRSPGRRTNLGSWLAKDDLKVRPQMFAAIKTARAFVNDPVDPLYMAVHLWSKTIPTSYVPSSGMAPEPVTIDARRIAKQLQMEYGVVRRADVDHALELLARAKLADRTDNDNWRVAWGVLRRRRGETERDLAAQIAERVCNPPRESQLVKVERLRRRIAKSEGATPTLFG
jgi:hypothetical protein